MMGMINKHIDLKENLLYRLYSELLSLLLIDRSSGKNIIWATDNYAQNGTGFQRYDHIEVSALIGSNGNVVKPRVVYEVILLVANPGRRKNLSLLFDALKLF